VNDRTQLPRAALRQQLLTDRLIGVRSVPLPSFGLRVLGSRVSTARPGAPQAGSAPGARRADAAVVAEKAARLRALDESQVRGCTKCGLCKTRTTTVFGQGSADARLVFVGEAPGFEEDRQGLAFVGRAGQLLTKMIVAMGLARDDVFICNVLKCRPPNNRDPSADEILSCSPYLLEQLGIIQPEVIVALGSPASKTLLSTASSVGKLRGRFHDYYPSGIAGVGAAILVMPTYHPAYLLRNPAEKGKAWEDLQMVMTHLGLKRP